MSQVTSAATDPFGLLRDFLRGAKYGTPLELMVAALRDEEPGEALLVEFGAQMRVNRRTRGSIATLTKAHGQSPWPRWYGVFARQVYKMMQVYGKMALPEEKAVGSLISAFRGMRRQWSHACFAAGGRDRDGPWRFRGDAAPPTPTQRQIHPRPSGPAWAAGG